MPGPGMEWVGEEEIQEVLDVLKGGYLFRYGTSPWGGVDPRFKGKVLRLEKEVTKLAGAGYGVAVSSGTTALLTALAALGVGPGDEVIVPGYTFVASLSSVIGSWAVPVLAEIDRTFNLDPKDVEAKITPRTRAILVVHMMGNAARMDELRAVADRHDLFLIEDCAQAFGATYRGRFLGSIGDIGTYSFNAYKTLTCGDGGMVVTDDEALYRRAFAFHDSGHAPLRTGVEVGKRPLIGFDFRMTEIHGAILLAQLRKLPDLVQKLRDNKKRFKERIADLPGLEFREITDPEGDLATMLTVILPAAEVARNIAEELHTKVAATGGWHVYNNMEHILEQRTVTPERSPFNSTFYTERGGNMKYYKGMLPQTDELLSRSINIGIGVSDSALGSAFGVTVNDGLDVVDKRADEFRKVANRYLA